ncbi:MAG: hypothetical protein V4674_04145 [Patescibacteria group bacterium]
MEKQRLVWGVRFEALDQNDAALKLNVACPSELEVVGHIDAAGTEHDGPPLPEGYLYVRSPKTSKREAKQFAVPKTARFDAMVIKTTQETGLPPPRSLVWECGEWKKARSFMDELNSLSGDDAKKLFAAAEKIGS